MLQEASVLVLDEPTNDLDVATLEVLSEAIQNFNGAVILVTHDRYFMDQVATDILSFPRATSPQKKLGRFVGYLQWEEAWLNEEPAAQDNPSVVLSEPIKSQAPKAQRMSFKLKNELEGMEVKILGMEDDLTKAQTEAASPDVISNAKRLQELHVKISNLQSEIEASYARWAELEKIAKGE